MNLVHACLASMATAAVIVSPLPASETAQQDSAAIEVQAEWKVEDLPPVLRARVHLTANALPPFPMPDSLQRDAHKWPPVWTIGGEPCSLRVRGGTDAVSDMRSLDEVGPGVWWYSLGYKCPPYDQRGGWAVSCYWNSSDGRLTERGWGGYARYGTRDFGGHNVLANRPGPPLRAAEPPSGSAGQPNSPRHRP